MPDDIKKKIALLTNLKFEDVVSAPDVKTIYEIPLIFKKEGLGSNILKKLNLQKKKDDSEDWEKWVNRVKNLKEEVVISIVGKYIQLNDSYKSLYEALFHGGVKNNLRVKLDLVESEDLLKCDLIETFKHSDAILIPGGFGIRGIEGMIKAAEYARINRVPFFGICLGMQVASIEFVRTFGAIKDANSVEFNKYTSNKIFLKLKELINIEELGHNMRLGNFECVLKKGTLCYSIYKTEKIFERHRHRFEFNPKFESDLKDNGMIISGKNPERNLVEMIELKGHPWFIGCQFHPEFKSKPLNPHPLFVSFVRSAKEFKKKKKL